MVRHVGLSDGRTTMPPGLARGYDRQVDVTWGRCKARGPSDDDGAVNELRRHHARVRLRLMPTQRFDEAPDVAPPRPRRPEGPLRVALLLGHADAAMGQDGRSTLPGPRPRLHVGNEPNHAVFNASAPRACIERPSWEGPTWRAAMASSRPASRAPICRGGPRVRTGRVTALRRG
jgi:hypothetical protein